VKFYFFEIVESAYDRYSWVLVTYRRGRRRIVARSNRDFGSPRRATRSARALQKAVAGARIVHAFPTPPKYTFKVVRDVLSLPVGSPDDDDAADRQAVVGAARS
jgi:predicted dinucleotide-binding enzyme